ncbi:MAG TPA: adenylate/guanylate cyclase domain-containing protein, partial [Candidatus Eremiobacteraceae bacterium]|nr:adenylate/guanylate cyclase domain-containing protein [Candidatus Eremiobacteraceae bacterium]
MTFLFSDIEGSTQRWELHRSAMAAALARHEAVVRTAIEQQNGYVFKTVGDAFCASFRRVSDAVAAALDTQRALNKEDFSSVEGLKVRIALHTGETTERDGDYFGPTVNRVARLLSTGHGGQILVSGATAELAQGEMPPQSSLRDLGAHRLKDLAHPEQIYQLVASDLERDFQPLQSLDALPHNLPLQVTSFVGREQEVEELKERLKKSRLVTLAGAAGVGKTRLALQVGADILEQFEDGVWLIELAPIPDPALVASVVASALNVPESQGRSLTESIVNSLRRKRALLIFDNCEHLLDAAAKLIDAIIRGCPNVNIIATSRQGLDIGGESVHRVPSLAL